MNQLEFFNYTYVVCTVDPPDGSGHIYDAATAEDALRQHQKRRESGRFPWLGEAESVALED